LLVPAKLDTLCLLGALSFIETKQISKASLFGNKVREDGEEAYPSLTLS